ncbi:glutaredoxin [Candidatus Woesearchaeota archaeon]|nr:MAG: glutaredoxin [Candidatus Woesearchaeota archaeon]
MVLPDDIKEQVKERLADMQDKVKIVFSENPSAPLNDEIKNLLQEVAELSDKIEFETAPDVFDMKPAFEIKGKNKGRIIFAGIPSGHEFATLLEDLIMASKGDSQLSDSTKEFLAGLTDKLQLKVFVTPTCPYCPRAVFLAHRMAMESDKVEGVMVEATEFPEESQKFSVSGVPHTIVNNKQGGFVGAHPEQSAVEEIKKALGQ